MLKNILTLLYLIYSISASAQIGSKVQSNKNTLAGTWTNSNFGYEMTLIFNQDSTGVFDGEKISYRLQGTRIQIKTNTQNNSYNYSLTGNTLTLSGGDLDAPVAFNKKSETSGNTTGNSATPISPTPANNQAASGSIIGTWSGNGETLIFNADGSCKYNSIDMKYNIAGNSLTIIGPAGNSTLQYTVNGNHLTMTGNGSTVMMQRGTAYSTPNVSGMASSSGNMTAGGGAGIIDPALVGKWCYVSSLTNPTASSSYSRCIVINANGTYEYNSEGSISGYGGGYYGGSTSQSSDRGTWKLAGNQLFVQSQKEGSKVYSFEKRNHPKSNEPMIVIDGDIYVTYYQKAPW